LSEKNAVESFCINASSQALVVSVFFLKTLIFEFTEFWLLSWQPVKSVKVSTHNNNFFILVSF
jgi:hypothetical protein